MDKSTGLFPEAAKLAEAENYLGTPEIVDGLVRGFIGSMLERHSDMSIERLAKIAADKDAINAIAMVFAGGDPNYQAMPQWHTRRALGFAMASRLGLDPNQSMIDICRSGFGKVALDVYAIESDLLGQRITQEQAEFRIDALIEETTSLLLGTIDTTHPLEED